MEICNLHHHRRPAIKQSSNIEFQPLLARNKFADTVCKAAGVDRSDLQTEGTQQPADLVLVVPKLVDEELTRNQLRAKLLLSTEFTCNFLNGPGRIN